MNKFYAVTAVIFLVAIFYRLANPYEPTGGKCMQYIDGRCTEVSYVAE
jgi:hypothetical protein